MDERSIKEARRILDAAPVPSEGRFVFHPEYGVLPAEDPRVQEYLARLSDSASEERK